MTILWNELWPKLLAVHLGGMCIDGACPAWDVSWSTDRLYQKNLCYLCHQWRTLLSTLVWRVGQARQLPGLSWAMGGQWRDVWCQGRFSIAWPRLPYFSRMPRPGEGVLHRKRWLKSLMSRKQIVNKVIHVSITLCALGPFYHTYYEQSPEKF